MPRSIFVNLFALVFLTTIAAADNEFPSELVQFEPYAGNPIFKGQGPGHWDAKIRERGWIMREEDQYHLWYTGYLGERKDTKFLGYATSKDGLTWRRHPENPIYRDGWVEDMMVVKHGDTYYMFAEGKGDIAQLLTSKDRLNWTREGSLDVRLKSGVPIPPGPYGTPTVWVENGIWHQFYERGDLGIWLATSTDRKVWTNVQDEPVIGIGPGAYDRDAIALNQIVKRDGRYYAYYHGTGTATDRQWCTCVAVSSDLFHWKKYPGNPIIQENKSSGILVHDGERFRLYTMHDQVQVHFSRPAKMDPE